MRFGTALFNTLPRTQPLVYIAPRHGFAAIALAHLAAMYGIRLVLFMPACARVSEHQAAAIELGAQPIFYRVAGMPNLRRAAEAWAKECHGLFIPMGLRHPLITAAIIKTTVNLARSWGVAPTDVWCAVSTGVLARGLQIGWPGARFHGVAVARNVKEGERGNMELSSYHLPFTRDAELQPPFPSASNYDAKAWDYMLRLAQDAIEPDNFTLFWNVAGDAPPTKPETYLIDSQRDWNESPR